MSKILGIDLGTTNSVVAVMEGGEPVVIPLADGSRLCPSVVGVSRDGQRLVGTLAKRQAVTNPDRTIESIKRKMGTNFRVEIDGKQYSAQEVSAQILGKLRQDAEAYLGQSISKAVITVPAYFSDAERQATKDAGEIAGLEVVRIINEPTAAALAYGMDNAQAHTVVVWDLGGGTFDVSVLELGDGVFEVKATNGDTKLGGDDWDQAVCDWMVAEFKTQTGVDLSKDKMALQRLREAAEKAKIELSSVVSTNINLPFISMTSDGPVHLDLTLTRARFEATVQHLTDRLVGPTKQALADAGLDPEKADQVLLVGGSTRMPSVQELVKSIFGKEPHRGINADEVVALGAAIQAGVLGGQVTDIVLLDVTPLSLGIETLGGVFTRLIERNTTIPTSKSEFFTTAADNQSTVDIHVLQGEREMAGDNKSLGRFQLSGIARAARGTPKIEVTFDIDVNGIVHVSARDTATGLKQSITITSSGSMNKSEVEKLVKQAEQMRTDDLKRRDLQTERNRAETVLLSADKTVREARSKVAESDLDTVQSGIRALREAMTQDDISKLRELSNKLAEQAYNLGVKASEAAEASAQTEPTVETTQEQTPEPSAEASPDELPEDNEPSDDRPDAEPAGDTEEQPQQV